MKKEIVYPGSVLASEMEFSAGKNSYTSEDGNVYSECIGTVSTDEKGRTIEVSPKVRRPKILEDGCIVVGRITKVKDNSVLMEIVEAYDKNNSPLVVHQSFALLPVRMASNYFVKDLEELFRIGDIMRAKVAESTDYGITITTKFPELGIIRAYCTQCREPMHIFEGKLKCLACGRTETRKLASDYPLK